MSQKKRLNWLSVIGLILLMFTLAGCGGGDSSPSPAIPTGVAATGQDKQITVKWTAVTNALSYNIYYSTTAGVTKTNGTAITNITTIPFKITGLIDGTTYHIVVTAVYAGGVESGTSSEVSATPIARPTGLVVSTENGQATAAWPLVSGATSYNLYYGTTNPVTTSDTKISVTSVAAGTTNGTPYFKQTVTPLANGTTYYFAVTAVNANGDESPLSSQDSAIPSTSGTPGSPTAVSISSTVATQVHVVWGDFVPDATSYNAYYLQQSTTPTTAAVISTGTKVPLVTPSPNDLTFPSGSGLTYWFVVTAVNGNGVESGGQTTPKSVVVQ